MRKRISVCMLAAMMSVISMYSFTAQGAEAKTEQETGIERESEMQAEEAVEPLSADRITLYTPVGMERATDGGLIICLTRNLAAYAVLGFLYYREMKWRGING